MARSVDHRLLGAGIAANAVSVLLVTAFLLYLLPATLSDEQRAAFFRRMIPISALTLAAAIFIGWLMLRKPYARLTQWVLEARPASYDERRLALRYPIQWTTRTFFLWVVGAGIVGVANFGVDEILAIGGTLTVILAGLATCSLQYLVVERLMRPLIALVLDGGPPPHTEIPGVATRIAMAWILATGVPVLGIIALGTLDFAGAAFNPAQVLTASFALAVAAVVLGFTSIAIVAISVAHPLVSMREALAQVEMGNLDARVAVDDGSEVGRLAAGFNRMVTGLAERERLRDALGAFVDPTLADRVLHEGIDLAGEIIEVSLLFLDVRGFTEFSESADANTIVTALNDLYGDVVPIILSHGGHANKFIGDGLLAVFGAPERLPDHADRAVAAGLEIVATIRNRAGSNLRVGIGINSGPVVVGTVGGGGRLDFTVIGDPVNTAARVEAATRVTGDDLLITDATRRLLTTDRTAWLERPAVPMKGKRSAVLLFADSGATTKNRDETTHSESGVRSWGMEGSPVEVVAEKQHSTPVVVAFQP